MNAAQGPFEGVTLSRTLPPILPSHFLSRRHLFGHLERHVPSSTLVIAPAGYGKSSLVADWSRNSEGKVAWLTLTQSDSLQDMSKLFVQATRNLIPGFGAWFQENELMRPTEVVRRWGNELLLTNQKFTFVLDNLRDDQSSELDIANNLIGQFPRNVHFVILRRTANQSLIDTCLARGEINMIGVNELRFSESEVEILASTIGVDISHPNAAEVAHYSKGWPAATSLILHQIADGMAPDLEHLMKNSGTPLNSLALAVTKTFHESDREILKRLSIVEEFTHELAEHLLAELYSYGQLSRITTSGEIFTTTTSPERSYQFSRLMRSVFFEELSQDRALMNELYLSLAGYYESIRREDLALDAAFKAGDQALVSKLFRNAARLKHAQGKGDDLLKWSVYAGASPTDGSYKESTVAISAALCNFDFAGASAAIAKLELTLDGAQDPEFFIQFTAASRAYLELYSGDFKSFDASYNRVMNAPDGVRIGVEEQVLLLRLAAAKSFILEDSRELAKIADLASICASQTKIDISHAYLNAIKALYLFNNGQYRQAYVITEIALAQFTRFGIVGLLGPIDLNFVMARCLLEFSRVEESRIYFEKSLLQAEQWKSWHWYITIDGYFARDLSLRGLFHEALERLSKTRTFIKNMGDSEVFQQLVDMSEMFVRLQMKDFERLSILLSRGLRTFYVEQFETILDLAREKKIPSMRSRIDKSESPRELIWLHIIECINVFATESAALEEMKKALKIGAAVGASETFLRQGAELGKLIIKIAQEIPTVYNEDLARQMAIRLQERGMERETTTQSLTKREREILTHLSTGRTLTVIAGELHISQNTMKTHLKNLYKKLEVDGRNTAVEKAKSLFLI